MTTITTRAGKGEPLTHPEVDANFTNLNTDKLESGDTAASLTITTADINGGTIDGTVIGGTTAAAGTFTSATISGDLTVDTNTLYVDSANNRVGIGTSSPDEKLEVYQGNIKLGTDTNTTSKLIFERSAANRAEIYVSNTNALQFDTGGSEAMRIDSSGNVGIGTSSPEANLHVDVLGGTFTANAGTAAVFQRNANTFNGCNVALIAGNASTASLQFGDAEDQSDGQVQYSHIDRSMRFQTAASEAMRIDSSGNLLVGTTVAPGTLVTSSTQEGLAYQSGDYLTVSRSGGAAIQPNRLTSDGDIIVLRRAGSPVGSISVTSSATSYNTSSDERLKENIEDAQPASDLIDGIQVREFDWKADGEHQRYGMIAQELETVAPEAVTKGDTEDDMWSVDYSKLVPMLVKEIQDLRKRVDELET